MRMRTRLMTTWTCAMSVGLFAASGCGAETEAPYDGPAIAITAAPLSLPGVGDGCYGLTIKNTDNEVVWSKAGICGHAYGAAASISYVGPCDASGDGLHTVELVLEELCTGTCGTGGAAGSDMGSYANPCPDGSPCIQTDVLCSENVDTPVTFEIAVMREANQGFFDIAVNFNDIFCSAKVDCAYPGPTADPADDIDIKLLHDGTGGRGFTAIIGFACTAGVGDGKSTVLAMSDIAVGHLTDFGIYASFTPDVDGNVDFDDPLVFFADTINPLYAAAVNRGEEQLTVGAASANKVYWNIMLGYNDLNLDDVGGIDGSMYVWFEATALDGADDNAAIPATPSGVTYPVIVGNVQLTDGNGKRVCSQHPLDFTVTVTRPLADPAASFVGVAYENEELGYEGLGFYPYP